MKIRKGFVSNSSSSSFILCFDEIPTITVDDLKKSDVIYDIYEEIDPHEKLSEEEFNIRLSDVCNAINYDIRSKVIHESDNHIAYNYLEEEFRKNVLSSFNCPSDQGVIEIIDKERIYSFMKEIKK